MTPAEAIFKITYENYNDIEKKQIEQKIKNAFSNFYKISNEDIELLYKMENLKIKLRGKEKKLYLFDETLSIENKIDYIKNLYENDSLWILTYSEIFIAFNISWNLTKYLQESLSKTKKTYIFNNLEKEIITIKKIIEELYIQTLNIIPNELNIRRMYGKVFSPTEDEKEQIKNYAKKIK